MRQWGEHSGKQQIAVETQVNTMKRLNMVVSGNLGTITKEVY